MTGDVDARRRGDLLRGHGEAPPRTVANLGRGVHDLQVRGLVRALGSRPNLRDAIAAGLARRDQDLLQLVVDPKLAGPDIARRAGVPQGQIYSVLHRTRARALQAAESWLLYSSSASGCEHVVDVRATTQHFDPLVRKRLARHLRSCLQCRSVAASHLAAVIDGGRGPERVVDAGTTP